MFKSLLLLITPLIFITGCARSTGFCPVEDATQAVIFGASELQKRQGLILEDSCLNYDHGITGLTLVFSSQATVNLCQSRFMLVDIVETYIRYFNDPVIFLPELRYPPFGPENLNITLTFESYYGQYVDLQYVNQIRMYNGCVTYYDFNAFDSKGDVFHKHSEFYNNTRLIVNAQSASKYPLTVDKSIYYEKEEKGEKKSNLEKILISTQ